MVIALPLASLNGSEQNFWIAKGKSKLPCKVIAEDYEKLVEVHSKYDFIKKSIDYKLQVPHTVILNTQQVS